MELELPQDCKEINTTDIESLIQKQLELPKHNMECTCFQLKCDGFDDIITKNTNIITVIDQLTGNKKPLEFEYCKEWFHIEDLKYDSHSKDYFYLLWQQVFFC